MFFSTNKRGIINKNQENNTFKNNNTNEKEYNSAIHLLKYNMIARLVNSSSNCSSCGK